MQITRMWQVLVLVLQILLSCHCPGVVSSPALVDKGFITNLTGNYDPHYRPVLNRSEKITIRILFGLLSLIGLDEKREVITCRAWVLMSWTDRLLKWEVNDSKADTPHVLHLPISAIWTPTIFLHNSVSDLRILKDPAFNVILNYTGNAMYSFSGILSTHCKVNIAMFPFDIHVCQLILSPFYGDVSGEVITLADENVNIEAFIENEEFELLEAKLTLQNLKIMESTDELSLLTLKLKRRRTFYILNNILPVVFLSVLSTFVFHLPEDSGEKMTMCISTLLSYAIFLTLISSYLPENSDVVCYFSIYLATLVFINVLTCIATILLLSLQDRLQKGKVIHEGRVVNIWVLLCFNGCLRRPPTTSEDDGTRPEICDGEIVRWCNTAAFIVVLGLTLGANVLFFAAVLIPRSED